MQIFNRDKKNAASKRKSTPPPPSRTGAGLRQKNGFWSLGDFERIIDRAPEKASLFSTSPWPIKMVWLTVLPPPMEENQL